MQFNGDSQKIQSTDALKASTDKPDEELDYTPAEETDMDFMTEEEEKTKKRNVIIGVIIGLLIVALLVGGFLYNSRVGKIGSSHTTTTASVSSSTKTTTEPTTVTTTRSYVTRQLTVHKDQDGVWRAYAGLDPTVGYTGVVGNDTGWWYVKDDVVDFSYNGIGSNDYGDWYVENGKVNLNYSGSIVENGVRYTIDHGQVARSQVIPTGAAATTVPAPNANTAPNGSTLPNGNTVPNGGNKAVVPGDNTNNGGANNGGANNGGANDGNNGGTNTTTVAPHEHHYVAVYDGNAIINTDYHGNACVCTECGLIFANAELLESHAYATGHTITRDGTYGGLDSKHIMSRDEVAGKEVITGYTNPENTYYVCTICGARTTSADEAGVGL